MRASIMLALFAAACAPERAPVDACTARMDRIEARLDRAASYADPPSAPPDVDLVAGRGVPLEGAPPMLVVADEVVLDGRGVGGGDDLERVAAALARDLLSLEETYGHGEGPWLVALWIEPHVDVEHLVRLLALAPPRVRFAVLVRPRDVRPRPWLLASLRGEPSLREERFDRLWARATEGCPAAREHLPRTIDAEGTPMGPASAARLVHVLRLCGCEGANLGAIEAIAVAALLGIDGGVARARPVVRFGPAVGPGEEIALPADTSAGELVRRLARTRDTTVWITTE